MTPEEITDVTLQYFPDAFWERMIKALFDAHETSYQEVMAGYERPEAQNLLGFIRRARVEQNLRGVAALFPEMTATSERPQGPWFHTEVRSGPMILTASGVSTPCEMAERADFRVSLAQENATLFQWPPAEVEVKNRPLYVILLHSRFRADPTEAQHPNLPGSAYLGFPSEDVDFYLHRINLMERYEEVVRELMPNEWNEEVRLRYFRQARFLGAA